MKITVTTDAPNLRKKMEEFRKVTGKDIRESLKAHARLACIYLTQRTQPFGNDDSAERKGLNRVSKDIDKVYYTEKSEKLYNQASNIAIRWYYAQEANANKREYRALVEKRFKDVRPRKSRGDLIASFQQRFKNYQANGNTEAIKTIVKAFKFKGILEGTFDSSYHEQSRNNKGRVSGDIKRTLVLGAENQLEAYRTRKMDHVGLSKAGWAVCADAIPVTGRVSSNVREVPAWVKRNMGRASGRIQDNSSLEGSPHVVMTNATPWASTVIPPNEAEKALSEAAKGYKAYMDITIAETLRKTQLASVA